MNDSFRKKVKKIALTLIIFFVVSSIVSINVYFNFNFLGSVWAHFLVGANISDVVKIFPASYMVDTDVTIQDLADKIGAKLITDTSFIPQMEIGDELYNCKCFTTKFYYVYTLDRIE